MQGRIHIAALFPFELKINRGLPPRIFLFHGPLHVNKRKHKPSVSHIYEDFKIVTLRKMKSLVLCKKPVLDYFTLTRSIKQISQQE